MILSSELCSCTWLRHLQSTCHFHDVSSHVWVFCIIQIWHCHPMCPCMLVLVCFLVLCFQMDYTIHFLLSFSFGCDISTDSSWTVLYFWVLKILSCAWVILYLSVVLPWLLISWCAWHNLYQHAIVTYFSMKTVFCNDIR